MKTTEEITKAILKRKKFHKGVKLSSPQRAGKYAQKSSYAQLKSREIFAKHFKN